MRCFSTIFELMGRHGALASAQAFVLHRERLSSPNVVEMDQRMVARARRASGWRSATTSRCRPSGKS